MGEEEVEAPREDDARERLVAETSEQRLRSLMAHSTDAIHIVDAEGILTWVSPSVTSMLGYEPTEMIGRFSGELIHPDIAEDAGEAFAKLLAEPEATHTAEIRVMHKDGTERVVSVTGTNAMHDPAVQGVIINYHDITERRAQHRALSRLGMLATKTRASLMAENGERLQELLAEITEAVCTWPGDGSSVELVNDEGMLDPVAFYHPDADLLKAFIEARTRTRTRFGDPETAEEGEMVLPPVAVALEGDMLQDVHPNYRLFVKRFGVVSSAIVPLVIDGTPIGVLGMLRTYPGAPPLSSDIGFLEEVAAHAALAIENDRLVHDLRIANRHRHELLSMLADAHDDERRRLAEALHDDPIQTLTAFSLRLAALAMTAPPEVQPRLIELEERANALVGRLRRTMFELHPHALGEGGLLLALKEHMAFTFADSPIKFEITDNAGDEPDQRALNTGYRIIQEALSNVRKHSDATHVWVKLSTRGDHFHIAIEDDGIGFGPIPTTPEPGHMGISKMRASAERLGGELTVRTRPDGGTIIDASVPSQAPSELR